ncbi:MAG: pilus assembly protein [Shinella sp.]|jgi:Flp pilus assembly protein TadG|nr:pilus assembly protein [Shinella sp.]
MKTGVRGKPIAGGVIRRFRRFLDDRRGVGAVEFAIVAPVLLMFYIGSFEISVAMTVARKVDRAANTVSDLLTQNETLSTVTLDSMKDVTTNVLEPFPAGEYTLRMTGIAISPTGEAKVAWSRDQNGATPYPKNSAVALPDDVDLTNTFVVRAELIVPHEILLMLPGLRGIVPNEVNLTRTSYFMKRQGTITCSDCG